MGDMKRAEIARSAPWWRRLLRKNPRIAIIHLEGVIAARLGNRRGLNYDDLVPAIDAAFAKKGLVAVVLAINSPGGSPAQSALIADYLRFKADEKAVPLLAFCGDAAASGGYWLACAADEIYALPSSIVGSIGVISSGFGFVDLIDKIGVERRLYTAGKSKSLLDPFLPEKTEDRERLAEIQQQLHAQFIAWVTARRAEKLAIVAEKTPELAEIFDGSFWTGEAALARGLVDGLAFPHRYLRERFGAQVKIAHYGKARRGLLGRMMGATVEGVVDQAMQQAWWQRLGL